MFYNQFSRVHNGFSLPLAINVNLLAKVMLKKRNTKQVEMIQEKALISKQKQVEIVLAKQAEASQRLKARVSKRRSSVSSITAIQPMVQGNQTVKKIELNLVTLPPSLSTMRENEETERPKCINTSDDPTEEDIEEHNIDHAVLRSWFPIV